MNFGNRNASSKQTTTDLLKAYTVAVTSAITIALSLRKVADVMLGGRTGVIAMLSVNVVNYAATTFASCANTSVMRMKELESGIMVKDDKTGEEIGMSKVAAQEAILNTCKSRMSFIVPIFFVPFFYNMALKSVRLLPKAHTPLAVAVEAGGIALGLYLAMPLNCALYPQNSTIDISRLEPEL